MPDENSMQGLYEQARMHDLYRSRRRTLILGPIMFSFVLFTLYCLFYFGPPVQGILNRYEQILNAQVEGMQKIPDLQNRLTKLESELNLLTTESVDARLKNIEQSIHVGRVKPGDVASLNDLKNEFQQLKTYMFRDPGELVELKELQSNYRKLAESQNQFATKESVQTEIAGIHSIFSILYVMIGIIFTILFGSLVFANRRGAKRDEIPTAPVGRADIPPNSPLPPVEGRE